jgi:hypothetical protein
MRRLVKKTKAGETVKDSDLQRLNLPKIGAGGQAAIRLVRISDSESYVV